MFLIEYWVASLDTSTLVRNDTFAIPPVAGAVSVGTFNVRT
jgi:hypothetical protein